MKLPDQLWLAELGRPQTTWVYDVEEDNSMDVMKNAAGIAYRLRWKLDEKELAVYESERTGGPAVKLHCPIRMQGFLICGQRLHAHMLWLKGFLAFQVLLPDTLSRWRYVL